MNGKNGDGAIRVVVAATSAVRRGGLETIVRGHSALKLIGSVPAVVGLPARVLEMRPDVLIVDLPESDSQFITAIAALTEAGIAIVTLIDEPQVGWTAQALRAGVRALLPRESPEHEIISAVLIANRGLVLLDPEVTRELASQTRAPVSGPLVGEPEELTAREIEVLRFMAEGLGNKEIASRLGISDHTVKFHISSILAKLGASSRTEAVTQAIRMGLVLL
jgi:two-component system, NarL family, response regulator YdfI